MKKETSKYQALLGVEVFEISNEFIYKLHQKQHSRQDVFKYLPEYTINTHKEAAKQPIRAEHFHQFIGTLKPDNEEKYLYFNLKTLDSVLQEEIDQSGIECLFGQFNFEKMLNNFEPQHGEDIKNFVFPKTNYLVIETTYVTSIDYYSGGYYCDMDIDIIGYLNNKHQIQYFK